MIEQYINEFVSRYLLVLKGLNKASTDRYRFVLVEFDAWLKGNAYEGDATVITREMVEEYLKHCFYRNNSNATRLTKLTALSQFFRYLAYARVIPADFTKEIPRPRLSKKCVQRFTKDEILRMFRCIDVQQEKGLRDACIMIFGAFAGLRNTEMRTITLSDLADEGKHMTLHVRGRFGKERSVWLWAAPSVFIRAYLAVRLQQGAKGDTPLLTTYRRGNRLTGRGMGITAIDDVIKLLADAAGVRKARKHPHMLRASHIHDLRHVKGFDPAAIAKRVGHSNIATTDRYMPDRERIHRIYNSLHEYWIEFPKLWNKAEGGRTDVHINHGGTDDAKN